MSIFKTLKVSDEELLLLVGQGNFEARKVLDERYYNYCKSLTKSFINLHSDFGFSFEDFLNAAMLGYCKARNKYDFASSGSFFPYFRSWAIGEMKALNDEGSKFFLNKNPSHFISLDLTYDTDGDSMLLAESIGNDDDNILDDIRFNELVTLITDMSTGLNDEEAIICTSLIMNYSENEIRDFLGIKYSKYKRFIASIKRKLKDKISD